MKDSKPQTPPLTRAGRKVADAALTAAKFTLTSDGKSAVRRFEVHGMVVTERVDAADAIPASSPPEKPPVHQLTSEGALLKASAPQTPPLSRQGRKVADATLDATKFVRTSDGKSVVRKFEVHGMAVTEYLGVDQVSDAGKG